MVQEWEELKEEEEGQGAADWGWQLVEHQEQKKRRKKRRKKMMMMMKMKKKKTKN